MIDLSHFKIEKNTFVPASTAIIAVKNNAFSASVRGEKVYFGTYNRPLMGRSSQTRTVDDRFELYLEIIVKGGEKVVTRSVYDEHQSEHSPSLSVFHELFEDTDNLNPATDPNHNTVKISENQWHPFQTSLLSMIHREARKELMLVEPCIGCNLKDL
jgi:hypothetical protein